MAPSEAPLCRATCTQRTVRLPGRLACVLLSHSEVDPLAAPCSQTVKPPRSLDKVFKQHNVQVAAAQVTVPRVGQHLQLPLLQRHHADLRGQTSDARRFSRPGAAARIKAELSYADIPTDTQLRPCCTQPACQHDVFGLTGSSRCAWPLASSSLIRALLAWVEEKPTSTMTTLTGSPSGRSVL